MKTIPLTVLLILFFATVQAQKPKETAIQEIILQDSFLVKQITLLIEERKNEQDGPFQKGLGYVRVTAEQFSRGDTLLSYNLNTAYSSLDSERAHYPNYYATVAKRLVLVYIPALDVLGASVYTSQSKEELKAKLEPYLPKTETLVWKNESGKVIHVDKKFRSGELMQMHGGKTIYMLKDKPPVVVRSVY
jgi:hypothetical protein